MEHEEYSKLARRESFYFWNVGRRAILREVLGRHLAPSASRKILDIGCGPGGNISILKGFGTVTGLDVSEEALRYARQLDFKEVVQGDATTLPFPDQSFDLVSSLDVFEHVEDDARALREAVRVLAPGGFLLITVPAHPWLWSPHDEALHHMRRYTGRRMCAMVRAAHLRIEERSHFVMPTALAHFPRKVFDRIFSRKKRVRTTYDIEFGPFMNYVLRTWLDVERCAMRVVPLPFGSSFVVLARKSGS